MKLKQSVLYFFTINCFALLITKIDLFFYLFKFVAIIINLTFEFES